MTSECLTFTDAAYSVASLLDTPVVPKLPSSACDLGAWLSAATEKNYALSTGERVLVDVAWSLYGNRRNAALMDLWLLDRGLRRAVLDTLDRVA